MEKRPGRSTPQISSSSKLRFRQAKAWSGDRPCAVFSYAGEAMDVQQAKRLLNDGH